MATKRKDAIRATIEDKRKLLEACNAYVRPIFDPFIEGLSQLLIAFPRATPKGSSVNSAICGLQAIWHNEHCAHIGHDIAPLREYLKKYRINAGISLSNTPSRSPAHRNVISCEFTCNGWEKLLEEQFGSIQPVITHVRIKIDDPKPIADFHIDPFSLLELAELNTITREMPKYWKDSMTWATLQA